MVGHVAGGLVVAHHARHGIGHAVAEMHARVAEPHAGICTGQNHLSPRFVVAGVSAGAKAAVEKAGGSVEVPAAKEAAGE